MGAGRSPARHGDLDPLRRWPVYTADRELLAQLTGFALTPRTVEQVCARPPGGCLEGIVDSTNVGALSSAALPR